MFRMGGGYSISIFLFIIGEHSIKISAAAPRAPDESKHSHLHLHFDWTLSCSALWDVWNRLA